MKNEKIPFHCQYIDKLVIYDKKGVCLNNSYGLERVKFHKSNILWSYDMSSGRMIYRCSNTSEYHVVCFLKTSAYIIISKEKTKGLCLYACYQIHNLEFLIPVAFKEHTSCMNCVWSSYITKLSLKGMHVIHSILVIWRQFGLNLFNHALEQLESIDSVKNI